ncbi:glycoside hydrolase family 15 [Cohnella sp. CFH 77786]|uniref:glycoside hydrolase family 15 protein n=1 Tax=Cohnella sp. CFH 77786 TaxID=2662265 RepID=UPI001C60D9CC|nr:glycoside hydrolase family 15 protein [Cohnella sp. CFH 77786]MBW5447757.1 glycoside hydrolase family 15 [Cohnella sp. CFH 77786]
MSDYLLRKPYLVDAVIGNSRFLASVLRTGRIVRLWWPHVDFPQHADTIRSGLRLSDSDRTTWFDGTEDGWQHESGYAERTNIFAVKAGCPGFPVRASSEIYAVPGEDLLVFDYRFTNTGNSPVSFSFLLYSSIRPEENPFYHTTQFRSEADALVHFRRQYYFSLSSANVCIKYQPGHAWEAACEGALDGEDIRMAPDGAMEWAFTDVAPGATVSHTVYLAAANTLDDSIKLVLRAKETDCRVWRDRTARYWNETLASAADCPFERPDIRDLYERSILTMKLMSDEQTGSIIAAPEFDERFSRCGGYAYCWGRDAAFITVALDKAGLTDMSTRFYEWTLTAQDKDGAWQQRHYHDGSLAPSWGLQIDEGSSILWGMYQHFEALPSGEKESFLRLVWDAVRRGAEFLVRSIDPENGLPLASRDLWEERLGQHTYSSSAVYAGLRAAASFAERAREPELSERWSRIAASIAEKILTLCWNEEKGVFYRGVELRVSRESYEEAAQAGLAVSVRTDGKGYKRYRKAYDPVIDVSLLGISVPFGVIPPSHPQAVRTAEAVERWLTVPGVGGIKRYEDDRYIGGNPWILTTLWLAQYRAANGETAEARKLLDWAVAHRTELGLLPEQVDKTSGETAWVVPLTWSHAMFILAVHLLAEAEKTDPASTS